MAKTLIITTTMTSCYRGNDPHNGHGNSLCCHHGNDIYLFVFYLFLEWRDLLVVMFFKRVELLRWLETTQGRHGETQRHNDNVRKQKHTRVAKVTPTADSTTVITRQGLSVLINIYTTLSKRSTEADPFWRIFSTTVDQIHCKMKMKLHHYLFLMVKFKCKNFNKHFFLLLFLQFKDYRLSTMNMLVSEVATRRLKMTCQQECKEAASQYATSCTTLATVNASTPQLIHVHIWNKPTS